MIETVNLKSLFLGIKPYFIFLRMIIGLLSFGLLKQPKTPIIPLSFDADYDMEKALVFGVIAIQLIYCPFDYDDWS